MNGDIKTYKVNGKVYDIPSDRAQEFLSEFKDAVELKSYIVGKDTLDIPAERESDFLQDYPDAQPTFGLKKKDEDSSISSTPPSQLEYPEQPEDRKPLDYILRKGSSQSILLKGLKLTADVKEALTYGMPNPFQYAVGNLQRERMDIEERFEDYDPGLVEDVAASAVGLIMDLPLFGGLGLASKAGINAGGKAAGYVAKQFVKAGATEEVAGQVAKKGLMKAIGKGMGQSGLTLGSYMALADAADQLETSESIEDFNEKRVLQSFGKGAVLGAGVGVIGAGSGILNSQVIDKAVKGTVAKIAAKGGITAAATTAEGGLFEVAGAAMTKGQKPTVEGFLHNTLLFGTMKLAGVPSNFKPKGDYVAKFDFTPDEIALINRKQKVGENKAEIMDALAKNDDAFNALMIDEKLPWTTKVKIMYGGTGKVPEEAPAVTGLNVKEAPDGRTVIETTDVNGAVVEREVYETRGEAMKDAAQIEAAIREGVALSNLFTSSPKDYSKIDDGLIDMGYEGGVNNDILSSGIRVKKGDRTPEQKKAVNDFMKLVDELEAEKEKEAKAQEKEKLKEAEKKPIKGETKPSEGKTPPEGEKAAEGAKKVPVSKEEEVKARYAEYDKRSLEVLNEIEKEGEGAKGYVEATANIEAKIVELRKKGDTAESSRLQTLLDEANNNKYVTAYGDINIQSIESIKSDINAGKVKPKTEKPQAPKTEEVKQPIAETAKTEAVVSEPPKKPPKPPKPPESEIPGDRVNPESPKEVAEFRNYTKKEKAEARGTYREKIIDRRIAINLGAYETNRKVHEINKRLKPHERQAVSLLIEKAGVPESLKGTDIEKAYNKPSKELKQTVHEVRQHFDDMWRDIVKNTDKLTAEQIENYVTHIWDIPKNKVDAVVSWFSTKNRFLKKRYIPSLKEGMDKFGLTPKTLDIGEIMKIHSATSRLAIENSKFIKEMLDMDIGGMPVMAKANKAPDGYMEYRHPALTYNKYVGERDGKPITVKEYYKIHPDMKSLFDVLFTSSKSNVKAVEAVWRAWEVAGNYAKKTALSVSLFHHGALTETAIAQAPTRTLKVIGKDLLWDTMKNMGKDAPAFKDVEMAREAIKDGVQLGATQDFDVNMIQRHLDWVAEHTKGVPLLSFATKNFAKFNKAWDTALWEYLHDGYKLYTHHHLVSKLKPEKMSAEQYKQARREIAQFVNDSFGGQNWDILLMSPTSQRLLRSVLLSPDWTVSTVRQALAPTGVGALYKNDNFWKLGSKGNPVNVRRKYGTAFWLKAAIIYGAGMNAINVTIRKKDVEENPQYYPKEFVNAVKNMDQLDKTSKEYREIIYKLSMMGNSVGHKTHLFIGRYEDGSERNLRWGKQFREAPELVMDDSGFSILKPTVKKIGGKAAPQLQFAIQMATGHTLSGYENYDLKDKDGWDYTMGVMYMLAKSALPYSSANIVRGDKEWGPLDLVAPSSKGTTPKKTISLFVKAIDQSDMQIASEVYEMAVRNNLDAYSLFTVAMNEYKATLANKEKTIKGDIEDLKKKKREEKDSDKKELIEIRIGDLLEKQEKVKESRSLHQQAMDEMEEYLKIYNDKYGKKEEKQKD